MNTNNPQNTLDRKRVARTWLCRSLGDLYCGFVLGDNFAFNDQERFLEIMGLEKCLKSVLLFHSHQHYEHLSETEARINRLAVSHGHEFDEMLRELLKLGLNDIELILKADFDGYNGTELVKAVRWRGHTWRES